MLPARPLVLLAALAALPAAAVDRLDDRDFATQTPACEDLYRFANGGWVQATPIEGERVNRFTALRKAAEAQRLELLQAALDRPADPLDQAIADLARSALDEVPLQASRKAALAALLPALDTLQGREQVGELIRAYQARGLPVLAQLGPGSTPKRVHVDVQVLGLPDPRFYTSDDPAVRDWLGRYRAYVQALLAAAGSPDPDGESAWVLDLEARVAQAVQPGTPIRSQPRRAFERAHPGLDLAGLLEDQGLRKRTEVELEGADQLAALDGLARALHPVQWRAWLRFRVVHLLAPWLDAPFREPWERFYRTGLAGQSRPTEPRLRALELVEHWLPEALAQRYLDRHFDARRQQAAEALVEALRGTLGEALADQPLWQETTRRRARAKLEALEVDFGLLPARPRIEVRLDPANLVGNLLAIGRWRAREASAENLARAGLVLQPQLGYLRERNRLLASASVWQPPLFDPEAEPALRFGGLGALLAHELVHGFDLGGASFDAEGRAEAWWEEADRAAWTTASAPLIQQYAGYPGSGDRPLDGGRVQAEALADLSGLEIAWRAFRRAQPDPELPVRWGLSPAQRFFVAWASLWREQASEEAQRSDLLHAAAPPAHYRAIGPLPHLPAFAQAFRCRPEQAMLRAPARVRMWSGEEPATP